MAMFAQSADGKVDGDAAPALSVVWPSSPIIAPPPAAITPALPLCLLVLGPCFLLGTDFLIDRDAYDRGDLIRPMFTIDALTAAAAWTAAARLIGGRRFLPWFAASLACLAFGLLMFATLAPFDIQEVVPYDEAFEDTSGWFGLGQGSPVLVGVSFLARAFGLIVAPIVILTASQSWRRAARAAAARTGDAPAEAAASNVDDADPDARRLQARLRQLDNALAEGLISLQEHEGRRQTLFERYGSRP